MDSYRGDGLNLYAYVSNNPIMYIDPSGHCKESSSGTLGREPYMHQFVTSAQYMDDSGSSVNRITNSSNLLKKIFDIYSIDAGVVDINPQTGQVILNYNFLDDIGLGSKNTNSLTRLDNGMVGTKYHLDVKTGMISYNGKDTNNIIGKESQWEIKYKYDLEEMKQLRIDSKNLVDNILMQQGIDLDHEYINKLNKKIDFFDNPIIEGGSKIYDFGSTFGLKVGQGFKEYLSLTGQPSYALFVGVLGAIEGAVQYKIERSA